MVAEVIEDQDLLDVLQMAIEFENTKGKQKSCFYCGEEFQKNSNLLKNEEIPDQWTCSKDHAITSRGWEWHDVTSNYHLVQRLLNLGLAKIKYKSNKHTEYSLADRSYAAKLVNYSQELKTNQDQVVVPDDLFANIVGYQDTKELLKRMILSQDPVHVLLVGPPASAKTMFQMEIERLPGAFFVDGANTSKAGLTDLMFSNNVRYLLIDEFEELGQNEMGGLLSFMQTGIISETKYGRTRTKAMNTCVLGSCNNISKLARKLMSRFLCLEFNEYTYDEFLEICRLVLPKQKKVDLILAEKIAHAVWNDLKSKDVRDALKVGSLVRNEKDVDWIIKTIHSK